MTPERKFWKLIKDHLPGDVSRIENVADEGTPDVSGAWKYRDYWVELKVCENKRDLRNVIDLLLESQRVWHLRRGRQGSIIYVAVRYPAMKRIILYEFIYKSADSTYRPVLDLKSKRGFDWDRLQYTIMVLLREANIKKWCT